ncbi:DedA family protein [Mucilaginibacter sp.]
MDSIWEHLRNLTDAQAIIGKGGFYLLLIVVYAETGLFFGFFLPGDYLLFMAGLFCATNVLDVSIYVLVTGLIAAGILGNYTGYLFGYRTGPMLFKRNESLFYKRRYVIMAEEFYQKYGGMALVLGRFFPIIRTFAPIFAGVVKVSFAKFTLYNFVGSVAWVCTLTLLGYYLGKTYPGLHNYLQWIVLGLISITTIPLLIAFFKKAGVKHTDETNINT